MTRKGTRLYVLLTLLLAARIFSGCGSLSKSAINGNAEGILHYLEKGENINQVDRYGWTPLIWATYYNHFEAIGLLLKKGADPNIQTGHAYGSVQKGSTALIVATYYGWSPTVRLLLQHGADKNIATVTGQTPLMLAERYNFTEIAGLLTAGGGAVIKKEPVSSEEGAQIVILKDGSRIVGKIISQTRDTVTVQTKYTTMTIGKDKISEMKYK